jgi:hypothetical protein
MRHRILDRAGRNEALDRRRPSRSSLTEDIDVVARAIDSETEYDRFGSAWLPDDAAVWLKISSCLKIEFRLIASAEQLLRWKLFNHG